MIHNLKIVLTLFGTIIFPTYGMHAHGRYSDDMFSRGQGTPRPVPTYNEQQNIDYRRPGNYQAQSSGHYVITQSNPSYSQPGLPWHARQMSQTHHVVQREPGLPWHARQEITASIVTHHVVHHHHYESVPQQRGASPAFDAPSYVHVHQPMSAITAPEGVLGRPVHPAGVFGRPAAPFLNQPGDILTRLVNHPFGKIAPTGKIFFQNSAAP